MYKELTDRQLQKLFLKQFDFWVKSIPKDNKNEFNKVCVMYQALIKRNIDVKF